LLKSENEALRARLAKEFKNLPYTHNFMFQQTLKHEKICQRLIETILGIRLERITYANTEQTQMPKYGKRSVRYDFYAHDTAGRVYDIEMQTSDSADDLARRSRYYQSILDVTEANAKRNFLYRELRRQYVIFICTFDPFHWGRHVYTFTGRCHEIPELDIDDGATRIFLNSRGALKDDCTPELRAYLDYVNGATAQSLNDEFVNELDALVNEIRRDEEQEAGFMNMELHMQERVNLAIRETENRTANSSIVKLISALRSLNADDDVIVRQLREQYELSEAEARARLKAVPT